MIDPVEWGKSVAATVKSYVAAALLPIAERLKALEERAPIAGAPGKDGRDGVDGKSVTLDDVLPVLKNLVNELPEPNDGKDGIDGEDGANGKDGRDGIDGKSITTDDVLPTLKQWFDELPKLKDGIDGKDGRDGIDGKSLTLEDIRPLFDKALAEWQLDFERRGMELIQRTLDRIEKPKDGRDGIDGKPGRDAFDLKDFDATLLDDERTLVLTFARGDDRVERHIRLPHAIYRGIWREGEYFKGDSVTFGGSTWIATRDTKSKPEQDDSWKLAVKRGRDGRDGDKGEKGDRGDPGRMVRE